MSMHAVCLDAWVKVHMTTSQFFLNIEGYLSNVLDTKSSLTAWLRENEGERERDANTYLRP